MRKSITTVIIAILTTILLAACSSSGNAKDDIDLSGNWAETGDIYLNFIAGYIENDRIELYRVSEKEDYSELYWSGTYKDVKKTKDGYTWTSSYCFWSKILSACPNVHI